MGISLKPQHLKRYKDIAFLLIKHGRADMLANTGLHEALGPEAVDKNLPREPRADELARDLEKMGPTFIKLGQLLSTRTHLLPRAYTLELANLHDQVPPIPFEQIEEILVAELKRPLSEVFASIEITPIGSASIAQVLEGLDQPGEES